MDTSRSELFSMQPEKYLAFSSWYKLVAYAVQYNHKFMMDVVSWTFGNDRQDQDQPASDPKQCSRTLGEIVNPK
jgi:hypothetical protein